MSEVALYEPCTLNFNSPHDKRTNFKVPNHTVPLMVQIGGFQTIVGPKRSMKFEKSTVGRKPENYLTRSILEIGLQKSAPLTNPSTHPLLLLT